MALRPLFQPKELFKLHVVDKDLPYYLAFSHCLGIGPIRFSLLIKQFLTAKLAYEAPSQKLEKLLHNHQVVEQFIAFRKKFKLEEKMLEIKKKDITVLTQKDTRYPRQLLDLEDSPICLYMRGSMAIKGNFFAIVGTRKASAYGLQITSTFSSELAQAGWIIVSGMALGVDTAAHMGALEADMPTVAFLGCGVDIVYPPQNQTLYEKIIQKGLVISEFPPGEVVKPGLFIARNRLISGLSKGVLVIEGTKHSGALITGRFAAEQGKDVFAPPVPLTSNLSEAPNILLKQGAKLVISTEDILEEYGIKYRAKANIMSKLSPEEQKIIDILKSDTQTLDDLASALKVGVSHLMPLLSVMEIHKLIVKNNEGKYQIL